MFGINTCKNLYMSWAGFEPAILVLEWNAQRNVTSVTSMTSMTSDVWRE